MNKKAYRFGSNVPTTVARLGSEQDANVSTRRCFGTFGTQRVAMNCSAGELWLKIQRSSCTYREDRVAVIQPWDEKLQSKQEG